MKRFIDGEDRSQVALLPECPDDFVDEDNSVRLIDAFVDELDLVALGSKAWIPRHRVGAERSKGGMPADPEGDPIRPSLMALAIGSGFVSRSSPGESDASADLFIDWLHSEAAREQEVPPALPQH
jgi:hypothetical protein